MNLKNVTRLLAASFDNLQDSHVTAEEQYFAKHLQQLLQKGLFVESDEDLEFENRWNLNNDYDLEDDYIIDHFRQETNEPDTENNSSSSQESQTTSSSYDPSPSKIPRIAPETSYETMIKVVEYCRSANPSKGKWRIGSAPQRFRAVFKDCTTKAAIRIKLDRFEKYIVTQGSRLEKLKRIHNYVLNKFCKAKHDYKIVHDRDLRYWAYQINKEVNLDSFRASDFWLYKFKTANRIVSRKINKTVTPRFVRDEVEIQEQADQFITTVNNEKENFMPHVFNTDQSGFNYEMHTGRTLAVKGSSQITALVQSEGATAHSYTIQPMIRADGTLYPILFLCLQERNGQFPNNPREHIVQYNNIYLKCSSSGKLVKDLIKGWFEDVFFPEVNRISSKSAMLLHDAWPGFKNLGIKEGLVIDLKVIPPKTTGMIQPLDVFFFRPWKVFVRYISDHIVLMDINVSLLQRNNIIKLQSLVHFQFSAERYKVMIRYAWFKAGYAVDRDDVVFLTPATFCFNTRPTHECFDCLKIEQEKQSVFARCSHCENYYCFNHFFIPDDPQSYHKC